MSYRFAKLGLSTVALQLRPCFTLGLLLLASVSAQVAGAGTYAPGVLMTAREACGAALGTRHGSDQAGAVMLSVLLADRGPCLGGRVLMAGWLPTAPDMVPLHPGAEPCQYSPAPSSTAVCTPAQARAP
jgi:hypothetical protein